MEHPLRSIPIQYHRHLFFAFLSLSLIMFAIFRVLDTPLRTDAAPNGIVSFELARTPQQSQAMIDVWTGRTTIYTDGENSNAMTVPPGEPFLYNAVPIISAAFGLGIDYLFMPVYALALGFGTLLVARKHTGMIRSLAVAAGYGALAAALFDAVENYALLQVLLGFVDSSYPAVAAFCAVVKFGLILIGIVVSLAGWITPKRQR